MDPNRGSHLAIELSPETRARIRSEEIFREEARLAVTGTGKRSSPIWRFLNSAFGLWLLSSCFVGVGTWLYSGWKAGVDQDVRRLERIRQLDTSIALRLRTLEHLLEYLADERVGMIEAQVFVTNFSGAFMQLFASNEGTSTQRDVSSSGTITAMLWELESLETGKAKHQVGRAIVFAEEINLLILGPLAENAFSYHFAGEENPELAHRVRGSLEGLLNIERWSRASAGGLNIREELKKRFDRR